VSPFWRHPSFQSIDFGRKEEGGEGGRKIGKREDRKERRKKRDQRSEIK
jgi:hypothetical protein